MTINPTQGIEPFDAPADVGIRPLPDDVLALVQLCEEVRAMREEMNRQNELIETIKDALGPTIAKLEKSPVFKMLGGL